MGYRAGAMRYRIAIQAETSGVDAFGAPTRTWTTVRSCWAAKENETYSSSESSSTPYENATRSLTWVIRNHASLDIDTRFRILDLSSTGTYAITAIRHDSLLDWAFIDAVSGGSDG